MVKYGCGDKRWSEFSAMVMSAIVVKQTGIARVSMVKRITIKFSVVVLFKYGKRCGSYGNKRTAGISQVVY